MTITTIGSINLDLIARVPRLPRPGETLTGSHFTTSPGGKGANQALAAKRAGAQVNMRGAVGGDANAAPALALLAQADVNLSAVQDLGNTVPTGVALILVDERSGENEIVVVPGANGLVDAADLAIGPNEIVLMQMEISDECNRIALQKAASMGALSILNIAPYAPSAAELSKMASIIVANETEFDLLADAMELRGADRPERARDFVLKTGKTIVITLGAKGAFAANQDGVVTAKAPAIEPVDTVGAGDTFCGYLGVGLQEGMTLGSALSFACKAGALACLNTGAQPAIPTRTAVDALAG